MLPLIEKARQGDPQARAELIARNRGLILRILEVNRFTHVRPDVTEADLFQVGAMGLLDAARLYDPARAEWSTYAGCAIKRRCQRLLKENHDQQPQDTASLDVLVPTGEGAVPLGEVLADEAATDPEAAAISADTAARVRAAVATLPPKHRAIIEELFFDPTGPQSLQTVGNRRNQTREGIRQQQLKAFGELRQRLAGYADAS